MLTIKIKLKKHPLRKDIKGYVDREIDSCKETMTSEYLQQLYKLSEKIETVFANTKVKQKNKKNFSDHPSIDQEQCREALKLFCKYYDEYQLHPISGTLLGLVREQDILPHD